MKRVVLAVLPFIVYASCTHPKIHAKMDFGSVCKGDLPCGWIVSATNKHFPAIWEVNEKKQLFIKYPRGHRANELNIFFTKDYYFKNGSIEAKIVSKKDAGVIFRARDRKNYVAVLLDFAKKRLLVERIKNKKITKLYEKPITLKGGVEDLKVRFCNDSIQIYLNGERIASLKDAALLGKGGVGVIATGDAQAVFDDITIEVVD